MTAAKFRGRSGEFSNLICLGVLHSGHKSRLAVFMQVLRPPAFRLLFPQFINEGTLGHFAGGNGDLVTPKKDRDLQKQMKIVWFFFV